MKRMQMGARRAERFNNEYIVVGFFYTSNFCNCELYPWNLAWDVDVLILLFRGYYIIGDHSGSGGGGVQASTSEWQFWLESCLEEIRFNTSRFHSGMFIESRNGIPHSCVPVFQWITYWVQLGWGGWVLDMLLYLLACVDVAGCGSAVDTSRRKWHVKWKGASPWLPATKIFVEIEEAHSILLEWSWDCVKWVWLSDRI
jgi:hypothetical protein